jgi:Immunity protein 21
MARWLDFSGAPPLLIPTRLVSHWRRGINPITGRYSELNTKTPQTDYDRACASAWPGRGILPIGNSSALVLYTEYDDHTWYEPYSIVACGGWLPSESELTAAHWEDPLAWEVGDTEFLLMNSAADGASGLRTDEYMEVCLVPGKYIVEYASLESQYVGCFHRLSLVASNQSAA